MEVPQYVAAVDLGTTKVAMAVGRKAEKNHIEILALEEVPSHGIIKGDLKNLEQASQALREVKTKIENKLGVTIHEAYVSISGQHLQCNRTQGYVSVQHLSSTGISEVRPSDVQRLIDDQRNAQIPAGKTILSILPQTYILDGEDEISVPVGMEGRKLEARFNVITGDENAIERTRRCFERAGLRLSGIVLQPVASAEAVLGDDEKELGVAVIDIGGGTTDFCIYYDKVIRHLSVIPIGGNIVNKDIRAYGILERYVEKLKTSFGEAIAERAPTDKYISIPSVGGQAPKEIAVKTLAGIIEARMQDIIDYVRLELDRCGYKERLGAGIVLTGGGANLKNLEQLFKAHIGIDVRVASPLTHLVPENAELAGSGKYATLIGTILDMLRQGKSTDIEARPTGYQPTPAPVAEPPQSSYQEPYRGYVPETYNPEAVQPAPGDSWGGEQPEYPSEDEIHVRKTPLKERMKRLFGSMFAEEIDDDENY